MRAFSSLTDAEIDQLDAVKRNYRLCTTSCGYRHDSEKVGYHYCSKRKTWTNSEVCLDDSNDCTRKRNALLESMLNGQQTLF